ncbi:MAG: hypothetical protein AVDCRST_MAG49-4523 [uncultured Thermomicrobiales bacterium]|uniref:Uncharacterized protein n=1 Tax=uncultured Thermomicrobiales bacterium TaxID=1645740 RepID=A0A6J4VGV5_9BACT|nr:MAG: hypothetical protein AVDCRST_MAG49-4523 [uncultured Thermomicrobiales bacterium]
MTEQGTGHDADKVEELIALVQPAVQQIIDRLEGEEFLTGQFIDVMQTDPGAADAYREALRQWGEGDRYAKMVVHGQVIPQALRRSTGVEWVGYAHGEDDPYAVPAWWRLTRTGEGERSEG